MKNFILRFFSIILLLTVLLFIFWNKMGSSGHFNLVILLIGLRYIFLYVSIALMTLRLFKPRIKNSSRVYTVVCMSNILIGLFSLVFYIFHQANLWWLNQTLLNWLFGLLMLLDIMISSIRRTIS